ncbi:hypothetical protein [Nocardioides sp. CER19]|uniref:hypothetical protein n=1 Tax=Nocardioides sp. CER19 TaxID=3038538 RepID=UPI002449B282|nr:hypothetical protein [Nocardioides sp. CER19]MDH2416164.1 hypothetical protein [Nocardioides sp. CER19]
MLDIGQHGWPATLVVDLAGNPGRITPSAVKDVVFAVDPQCVTLRTSTIRRSETVRLAAPRAALAGKAQRDAAQDAADDDKSRSGNQPPADRDGW